MDIKEEPLMYMGHFGIALAGKGMDHRIPLWFLIIASVAVDLTDSLARLAGIEGPVVFSVTHSLPGGLGLAILLAAMYALFWQRKGMILVGFITFSHTIADLITSKIPLWSGGPKAGLHLYRYDYADFTIEIMLVVAGWLLYQRTLPEEKRRTWPAWLMLGSLALFQLYFQLQPIT